MSTIDTDKPRVSYVIGRLDRALSRELERRLARHGLSLPQYTALSVLRMASGLSNAQVARRTFVRPQSMIQVINTLERQGLISRAPTQGHKRVLHTQLTDKGRSVLAECERSVTEIEVEMLTDLSVDEQASLRDALLSCVRGLGAGLDAPRLRMTSNARNQAPNR